MAVKIGNLWDDPKFQALDDTSKLLYIHIASSPSISTLGVVMLNMHLVGLKLSKTMDELRDAAIDLKRADYVVIHNASGIVYFVVLHHFQTLPKSELLVKKANTEMSTLPEKLRTILEPLIDISKKFLTFSEPTEQEVIDFAASKGYIIDAKAFIGFYKNNAERLGKTSGWFDSRGKQVKDWKGKLSKVWFKDENKLKGCDDAPEGYKYFHAVLEGKIVFPDYWKDDKPFSKEGLIVNTKLQEEYARKRRS